MLNITFVVTLARQGLVRVVAMHPHVPVCSATSSRLTHILVCGFLPTGKWLCTVKAIT